MIPSHRLLIHNISDFLTFRDAPKRFGDDEDIRRKLLPLQPNPPIDTSTITNERIDNTRSLPRGACTGTLIPENPEPPSPTPPSPPPPPSGDCDDDCSFRFTLDNRQVEQGCYWITKNPKQTRQRKSRYCNKRNIKAACPATCDTSCANDKSYFFNLRNGKRQKCWWLTRNKEQAAKRKRMYCKGAVATSCSGACGKCDGTNANVFDV